MNDDDISESYLVVEMIGINLELNMEFNLKI